MVVDFAAILNLIHQGIVNPNCFIKTDMQTKVLSSELKIGMFVELLDRPWLDTPFMLQGFLIHDDEDIRLLQQYCEFVQVDWSKSTLPPPAGAINRKNQPVAPIGVKNPSPYITYQSAGAGNKPRPLDTAIDAEGDSVRESMLSEVASRIFGFWKKSPEKSKTLASPSRQHSIMEDVPEKYERPAFIPANIELSTYVEVRPVEEEIAPAVKAHSHANEVYDNLVEDIRSNKRFVFAETESVAKEVVDSMVRNPDAMMWITRLRKQDEMIYGHGLQVAVNMVALGRHLGLPKDFLDRLCAIGLLLDIGKIKLPKELLLKKERLDSEEFDTIKSHVQLALDILKETPDLHPDVLKGIAQHHEREDGSGYPAGLSGKEMSLFGRLAAIVDAFSALTSPRPYAEAMPAYEALQCLANFNSNLFQASMVEQLIQAIGVFPVGSMVELSSGEVAVVISHSKVRRLKPRVLIISDSNKCPSPQPTSLDLLYQPQVVDKDDVHISRGLPAGAYGLDAREFFLV